MIKLGLQFFGNGNSGAKGAGMSGGGGSAAGKSTEPVEYRKFADDYEAEQAFDRSYNDWEGDWLSSQNYDDIQEYTGNGYQAVNRYLRGQSNPQGSAKRELDKTIESISYGISGYELTENIQVYRGMDVNIAQVFGTDDVNQLSNGYIFTEKAFSSTTAVKGSNSFFEGNVSMTINVPKGRGYGAWVEPLSKNQGENEFLINKGASFKFKSAYYKYDEYQNMNILVIEADLIGFDPNA